MKIKILFIIVFLSTIILFAYFNQTKIQTEIKNKICFTKICFNIEVAETAEQLIKGLMDRKSLPQDQGMLFVFNQEDIRYFWMKNTLVFLDMIWLNEDLEIIYIQKKAPPCHDSDCPSYGPGQPAVYVLEINGGLSDSFNLEVGDKATLYINQQSL